MIIVGWNEFVTAFGKECIVNTPYGSKLSVKRILKGNPLKVLLNMGFEIGKTYQSQGFGKEYGEFVPIKHIGYTTEMVAIYDITEIFKKNHHFFVAPTKKIIVHG